MPDTSSDPTPHGSSRREAAVLAAWILGALTLVLAIANGVGQNWLSMASNLAVTASMALLITSQRRRA